MAPEKTSILLLQMFRSNSRGDESVSVGRCGWKEERQVVVVGQPSKLGASFFIPFVKSSSNRSRSQV